MNIQVRLLPHNVLFIHINSPVNKTSASTYANILQSFRTQVMPIPIHAINHSSDPMLPLSHTGPSLSYLLLHYTHGKLSARHPFLHKSFQKPTVQWNAASCFIAFGLSTFALTAEDNASIQKSFLKYHKLSSNRRLPDKDRTHNEAELRFIILKL